MVVALLDGLTEEQAQRRVVPSLTTLFGLVKHAAFVEGVWFDVAVAGRSRAEVGLPDTVDEIFELGADDTGQSVTQLYRDAAVPRRLVSRSPRLRRLRVGRPRAAQSPRAGIPALDLTALDP